MVDVFTVEKRSEVMARIRGFGNKSTEMVVASLMRRNGIKGWRRHYRIFGRPDFAFPALKVAIFVDGCFWHRCPKHASLPVHNREFWNRKLSQNVARDKTVTRNLQRRGWSVLRIWQHDLAKTNLLNVLSRITKGLSAAQKLHGSPKGRIRHTSNTESSNDCDT